MSPAGARGEAVAVVTTTIHVPTLLDDYMRDAGAHGHRDTIFVVVGDRETPAEARGFCADLAARHPFEVVFLGVDDQERYLVPYPELARHLPWNSIQRRNVGLLLAWERGAERIITIDDDNLLEEPDFIGGHAVAGREIEIETYATPAGWLNVCDFLDEAHGFRFFHRGFPPEAKAATAASAPVARRARGRVVVNAGLWLDAPDVDAVTRLALPLQVTGLRREANFALAPGTWSPFNSQNTALARAVVPAYFLSPLVGRYDDIWASYVVKAIADHLGDLVAFGHPVVRQVRNPHDDWKDLAAEQDGMRLTGAFCRWLKSITLRGDGYAACYGEVIDGLARLVETDPSIDGAGRAYLGGYLRGMHAWRVTIARVPRRPEGRAV